MELLRALAAFAEPPGEGHQRLAGALELPPATPATWHATFVERFYPYASVHLGTDGFVGGTVRDRVAGVLRALEATVPAEPDHLVVLLDALATTIEHEWWPAAGALLWEHLLPWTVPLLDRIAADGPPPYDRWATLTQETLTHTAGQVAGPPPPPLPEIGLLDPRAHPAGDFVDSLLVPARLGAILTIDDLHAAADELQLPIRMGERRYALRGLLAIDTAGILAWLADHAERSAIRAEGWPPAFSSITETWSQRAGRAHDLLAGLAADARADSAA